MRKMMLCLLGWFVLSCGGAATPAATTGRTVSPKTNPFLGESLYVDNQSQAAYALAHAEDETEAALLRKIAETPQADWLGEWSGFIESAVQRYMDAAAQQGKLRVMIVYNIPNRDCGQYSKGGQEDAARYLEWIKGIAAGIGNRKTVLVLEPDALGQLDTCLSKADQAARLQMLKDAVALLKAQPGTSVYIDAGNANWVDAKDMAKRLEGAGIAAADGFALNVSNYVATDKTIAYGEKISNALGGGVPFVIDTSRNGQGEAPDQAWCNPPGRGLGTAPTTQTGNPLVHAFLWLKRPGESDGTCNDGPPAGSWFPDQALELARNAKM